MNVIKYNRNFLLALFMLTFGVGFSFAQSNYEKATQYYIAGDYPNAAEYFKKTILEDKKYDGTIFYRLGYSMEQSKFPASEYSVYFCAAAYVFEKTKETENKYYSYAIGKESKLGVSHKDFSDETIKGLVNGNRSIQNLASSFVEFLVGIVDKAINKMTTGWFIFYCFFVVCTYIVGRIFSSTTECVILSSLGEIFLLFLPFLVVIFLFACAALKTTDDGSILLAVLLPLSILLTLISSIVFSVRENIGTSNPWLYITISLVTKMALFLVTPVTIFVTLCVLPQAKKDYRYRDGTKYNQHTRNVATFMAVLTGLILSLIKQPEKNYK